MYGKNTEFGHIEAKVPHWLKGKNSPSGREQKTTLRKHWILRTLALRGPLSIYGVQREIREREREKVPYSRLRDYIGKLEGMGLIHKSSEPAKTKRKERIYVVDDPVIGYLYYQHFLTKLEVIDIIERGLPVHSILKTASISTKELSDVIEPLLSSEFEGLLISMHAPRRVHEITPRETEDIRKDLVFTKYRDITVQVLLLALRKLVRAGKLELLRGVAKSDPLAFEDIVQLVEIWHHNSKRILAEFQAELKDFDKVVQTLGEIKNEVGSPSP